MSGPQRSGAQQPAPRGLLAREQPFASVPWPAGSPGQQPHPCSAGQSHPTRLLVEPRQWPASLRISFGKSVACLLPRSYCPLSSKPRSPQPSPVTAWLRPLSSNPRCPCSHNPVHSLSSGSPVMPRARSSLQSTLSHCLQPAWAEDVPQSSRSGSFSLKPSASGSSPLARHYEQPAAPSLCIDVSSAKFPTLARAFCLPPNPRTQAPVGRAVGDFIMRPHFLVIRCESPSEWP